MQKRRGGDVVGSLEAKRNSENGNERVSIRDKALHDTKAREKLK